MSQIKRTIHNGYIYIVAIRDEKNNLYSLINTEPELFRKGVFSFSKKSCILLNKKDLKQFSNKKNIKYKIDNKLPENRQAKIIILRTTSKKFKKLYSLIYENNSLILKENFDYDLLLHKAIKYVR